MPRIITREWTSRGPTGRKVRHVSYGYQLMVNGARERRVSAEWQTEAEAFEELTKRLKDIQAGQVTRSADKTLSELAEEYPLQAGPWQAVAQGGYTDPQEA